MYRLTRVVAETVQRENHRVFGDHPCFGARGENVRTGPRYCAQPGQHRNTLRRQWNDVFSARLHSISWDPPYGGLTLELFEFSPLGKPSFARTYERKQN